jgi:hypothetical protein
MCECDIPKRYKKRLLPINPANDQLPIYNTATGKWELINKADIGGGGSTAFNGNRAITRSPFEGLNVGGNTQEEFLNNFFFPKKPPVFALTNLGTTYIERGWYPAPGVSHPYGNFDFFGGSFTLNDGTELEYRVYNNQTGTAWPNNSAPWVPYTGGALAAYIDTQNVGWSNINADWRIQLRYKLNGVLQAPILSGLKSLRYITPFFYGMVSGATPDLPNTKAGLLSAGLTRVLNPFGNNIPLTYNGVDKFQVIAYPAIYPDLTDIRDPNGFPVLAGWTKITGNVSGFGDEGAVDTDQLNTAYAYKLYHGPITTVNNGIFTFKNT